MQKETAGGRYKALLTFREPYLFRGRKAAELTIPSLLPQEGSSGSTEFKTPFQGLGARGVNNLSSKLLLALMPPNSPFFRMLIDDYTLEEMTQQEGMRATVEEALGKIERAVQTDIEARAARVTVGEALKQLVIAGNVLLFVPPTGSLRAFRIDRYVVKRDPMGNVLEIITKEEVSPAVLPSYTVVKEGETKEKATGDAKTVELYTHIKLEDKKWTVYQEAKGERIEGSEGSYPVDKSPWIPLRFIKVDGEDYGRGYVEEYYGDLVSLEALTKAIVEGSAAAAKILILVNPNGLTEQKTIAEAPNGAVRAGSREDVSVLQLDKFHDFRIAFQTIESITSRLSFAFLLNTAVQRGGERVTAEEIRYMAGELEDAIGGVYSILSQEFQLPLVRQVMNELERAKRIPKLPSGVVKPSITTGLEALGRGHDLNKLDVLFRGVVDTFGQEALSRYANVGDYMTRRGTALGIDMKGLVRSEEEIQEEEAAQQEAAQGQQMTEALTSGGIDVTKQAITEGMKQNGGT
jgi:hypothetical protein